MTKDLVLGWGVPLLYLLSAVFFIVGLKLLTKVRSARKGNAYATLGMLIAIVATLIKVGTVDYRWILGGLAAGTVLGLISAMRVPMTSMPELVAVFNGLGGAASLLVALSTTWLRVIEQPSAPGPEPLMAILGGAGAVMVPLSILVGGVTLTGSIVAFLKLLGKFGYGRPIMLPARHLINFLLVGGALSAAAIFALVPLETPQVRELALVLTGVALLLGWLLVLPIGGADMPVVVSLLNSYSGVAAAAAGFVIDNTLLIIAGAMVGSAGLILTKIMCVAMNRSLLNVLVGGFGQGASSGPQEASEYVNVKSAGPEEAAMVLENATSVIIVPGYGLAVAQAQHAAKELSDLLIARGCEVRFAIHPVAGRMPGHMNVLLAEADVPYERLVEMDIINSDFRNTDVVIVLGANDVVNPAAATDPASPIFGMPILEAHQAQTVFVVKRSLGAGYAGVKNVLFERDNTVMLFGDAKAVLQSLATEVKAL